MSALRTATAAFLAIFASHHVRSAVGVLDDEARHNLKIGTLFFFVYAIVTMLGNWFLVFSWYETDMGFLEKWDVAFPSKDLLRCSTWVLMLVTCEGLRFQLRRCKSTAGEAATFAYHYQALEDSVRAASRMWAPWSAAVLLLSMRIFLYYKTSFAGIAYVVVCTDVLAFLGPAAVYNHDMMRTSRSLAGNMYDSQMDRNALTTEVALVLARPAYFKMGGMLKVTPFTWRSALFLMVCKGALVWFLRELIPREVLSREAKPP